MRTCLPLLVSIDARRPVAWLTLAAAAGAAVVLAVAPGGDAPTPPVTAVVVGALLAVAAIGGSACPWGVGGCGAVWWAERAAWPLLGWLLAAGWWGDGPLVACGACGIAIGAALLALLCRTGLLAADAASVTLVAACGAGAAGWWADGAWSGLLPGGVVAAGVFGVAALLAGALLGGREFRSATSARYTTRHLLTAAAMMGAMAGMVGWLFLATEHAACDLVASLAWFGALAVPAATLGDGVSHAAVWRRLEQAAPGGAGPRLRLAPGRMRDGVQAVVTTAAVLGWPPLVAAALAGGDVARSGAAFLVVAALAAAAVLLLAAVGLARLVAAAPDTHLALVGVAVCLAAAVAGAGHTPFLLSCLRIGG